MNPHFLEESNIPKRYLCGAPLNSEGPWEQQARKILASAGSGFLIALIGPSGVGKSQIGASMVYNECKAGKKARFCEAMEIFLRLKATYGGRAEGTELEVLNEFVSPSLLVIDEFDKRAETKWEDGMLFYLINRRYNAVKDTLLIGNMTRSSFEESVGAPVVSRMNETGGIIVCDWKSFR